MDKRANNSAASPGYETRDANVRGVFNFLAFLAVLLVVSGLVSWGLFRYFSRQQSAQIAVSPFADTRQMPLGPQLQVNPRQDLLKYREQQEQALESLEWENRGTGIVRVPIERAMELLVQKGLPVQTPGQPQAATSTAVLPAASAKPAPEGEKKP